MINDPHKTTNIKIQNKKIPIWTYGNPKNPSIFFIHGFFRGFSDYTGDLPVRYLMKKYCVVCFDLPGFGYSREVNLDNLEFINQIQKEIIKNKKVILFGVSYGGLLSLEYSAKFPEKVNSAIIAGTPVFYKIFNFYKLVRFLPKYDGKKITNEIFDEFKFLNKKDLNKINTPVLLYYNKSDWVANIIMGKYLNKHLPNSKIFISSKQNHRWLLHRIDKNGVLERINSFLEEV